MLIFIVYLVPGKRGYTITCGCVPFINLFIFDYKLIFSAGLFKKLYRLLKLIFKY